MVCGLGHYSGVGMLAFYFGSFISRFQLFQFLLFSFRMEELFLSPFWLKSALHSSPRFETSIALSIRTNFPH